MPGSAARGIWVERLSCREGCVHLLVLKVGRRPTGDLRAQPIVAYHGRSYLLSEPGTRVHGAALVQQEAICPALLARP